MKKVGDIFRKVIDVFKKPQWLMCLGLAIILFSSLFAQIANTSGYKVKVTEVKMETGENKYLVGLRYAPKSCGEDNKCAVIVTTHGYLNSKEMQDVGAIELSKRGYIVYAMDQYDHGDSYREKGGFDFWITSQWDAVNWIYEHEKALLKANDGTAMMAVAGHSMGGFSSRMAAYLDELTTTLDPTAKQKIVAVLSMGADYQWVDNMAAYVAAIGKPTAEKMILASDDRSMGTIAARYDEFFFNSSCSKAYKTLADGKTPDYTKPYASCDYSGNQVVEKNWGETVHGKATYYNVPLLTIIDGQYKTVESGVWNDSVKGGRVIYIPNEIHPWNHFSTESAAYQIDFYNKAFAKQFEIHNVDATMGVVEYSQSTTQTWWLKEGFNGLGLVGVFVAVVAAIALFAKLPFFNKVTSGEINETTRATGARGKLMLIFSIATTFATAWAFPVLNGAYTTDAYVSVVKAVMWACAIVLLAAGITYFVVKAIKGEDERANKVIANVVIGAISIFGAAFLAHFALTRKFFTVAAYYNESYTSTIGSWALVSASLMLMATTIGHYLSNKKEGYTIANYGLKANWKQILIALLIAVLVVGGIYGITFLVEWLLHVDFRLWTYAIKPFTKDHFMTFLRYLPVYFAFYLMLSVSIVANTGHDKTWKGTLKAVLYGCLGCAFILALHYGQLFITGTAKWPGLALNMILVWALVPTLALAAWITRKSYLKTGNIWTAVFINALLFTLMQVANTTIVLAG